MDYFALSSLPDSAFLETFFGSLFKEICIEIMYVEIYIDGLKSQGLTSFYRVSLIRGKPIIFEKSSVVASTASSSVSVVSSKVTDNKDVTDESMYDGEDDIRELDWDSDSVLFDPNVCSYK